MSDDDSEMMDEQAMSWERLNAYVDGELAPADAAAVASAVAQDPGLARRVATLARLKANVTGLPRQGRRPSPFRNAEWKREEPHAVWRRSPQRSLSSPVWALPSGLHRQERAI